VTRFANARDAKEFLIAQIVEEAHREQVSLSEVERKMLYFTETGWAPPDIMATNDEFDRDYNQGKYEKKIAGLIHHARQHAGMQGKECSDAWAGAIRTLRKEDHYLLVMIDQSDSIERPRFDRLKLWATAIALVCGGFLVAYIAHRFAVKVPSGLVVAVGWVVGICIVAFRSFSRKR
jgi:hypothetical protein